MLAPQIKIKPAPNTTLIEAWQPQPHTCNCNSLEAKDSKLQKILRFMTGRHPSLLQQDKHKSI